MPVDQEIGYLARSWRCFEAPAATAEFMIPIDIRNPDHPGID
jgi:hypothetical protein